MAGIPGPDAPLDEWITFYAPENIYRMAGNAADVPVYRFLQELKRLREAVALFPAFASVEATAAAVETLDKAAHWARPPATATELPDGLTAMLVAVEAALHPTSGTTEKTNG